MRLSIAIVLTAGATLSGEPLAVTEFEWPMGVKPKLEEALTVRVRAEGRPTKDVLVEAKKFESLLEEVGENQELAGKKTELAKIESEDLLAKLALMALDRKNHLSRYEEIGKNYVYLPLTREERAKYHKVPVEEVDFYSRRGPRTVSVEHATEKFRLALEYHMLAPPTKIPFPEYRPHLAPAMAYVSRDKGVIILESLLSTFVDYPFGHMIILNVLTGLPSKKTLLALERWSKEDTDIRRSEILERIASLKLQKPDDFLKWQEVAEDNKGDDAVEDLCAAILAIE